MNELNNALTHIPQVSHLLAWVPEESKEMITNYDGICIAHHI
jgi:hypothetical protein